MARPKQYVVYDKNTGDFLVEGTARYCSAVLHVGGDAIRAISRGTYNSSRFRVEEQAPDGPVKEVDSGLKAAAMAWDKFREPICRKYGIPTYKAPEKEDEPC